MPRKTPRQFECQQCGRTFDSLDYRPNRMPKVCSRTCRDDARRTKVSLICRQCGESFLRKAYQENWSQERGPFCSMPCYGAWQRENVQGPENPNWVEQSNARYGGRWERNRLAALERDRLRCVECGSPDFSACASRSALGSWPGRPACTGQSEDTVRWPPSCGPQGSRWVVSVLPE